MKGRRAPHAAQRVQKFLDDIARRRDALSQAELGLQVPSSVRTQKRAGALTIPHLTHPVALILPWDGLRQMYV